MNENINQSIEEKIVELSILFDENKGIILTEDDLKYHLVNKLFEIEYLSGFHKTYDESIKAVKIHCELSWYDENGKLTIKPDITIIEPFNLSILHGINFKKVPSKGFNFVGEAIIFELKFIRNKKGITNKLFKDEILKDWNKINRLINKLSLPPIENIPQCYMVIFSKYNIVCDDFTKLILQNNNEHIKIIYHSGNVNIAA